MNNGDGEHSEWTKISWGLGWLTAGGASSSVVVVVVVVVVATTHETET